MNPKPFKLKSIISLYIPLLFSFLSARAIAQTDLVMLNSFGPVFVAAHAIAMKLMIIDTLVAMAIGPAAALMVSQEEIHSRHKILKNLIPFIFYLGVFLVVIGLLIYPMLADLTVGDSQVKKIARISIAANTLTILPRLLFFVASLIANLYGKGKRIVMIGIFSICINGILNFIFMYPLRLGFVGCYVSTFLTSALQAGVLLHLIPGLGWKSLVTIPCFEWCQRFVKRVLPEFARVSSGTLSIAALAAIFAHRAPLGPLTAFGVVTELHLLISMPLVALMRSVSLEVAPLKKYFTHSQHIVAFGPLYMIVGGLSLLGASLIWGMTDWMATHIYALQGSAASWFSTYSHTMALALPFWAIHYLFQGVLQGRQEYRMMALADGVIQWVFMLPICAIGLLTDNQQIVWLGYVFGAALPGYVAVTFIKIKEKK
jgi:Na+-driven multidrug efflux pump